MHCVRCAVCCAFSEKDTSAILSLGHVSGAGDSSTAIVRRLAQIWWWVKLAQGARACLAEDKPADAVVTEVFALEGKNVVTTTLA